MADTESLATSLASLVQIQQKNSKALQDHIAESARQQARLEQLISGTAAQPQLLQQSRSRDDSIPVPALEGSTAVRA
eukprot:COSAG01_NODE_23642_length_807_cov_1.114407_2_plen_76_part_01